MRDYQRFFIPGGADAVADAGLLILRLFAGLAMAFAHGLGKLPPSPGFVNTVGNLGFPAPELFAWSAGVAEFAGGLLLAIGLLTRPASLAIALTMAVAAFGRHADDPFAGKEKALLFMFVALMFLLTGPGRFSVDALLGRRPAAGAPRTPGRFSVDALLGRRPGAGAPRRFRRV